MYYFTEYCVTTVSSLTLIAISIERYIAVTKPFKVIFRIKTKMDYIILLNIILIFKVKLYFNNKVSLSIIFSIWTIGIFISIPLLWMVDFITDYQQCQLNMKRFHFIYVIGLNVVLIFIPVMILPILYIIMYIKMKSFDKNTTFVNDSLNRKYEYKSLSLSKGSLNKIQNNPKFSVCSISANENCKKTSITRQGLLLHHNNFCKETSVILIQNTKRKNHLNFIIIVTIVFFCCQLPVRIFLCWSYLINQFSPIVVNDNNLEIKVDESNIFLINLISQITSLIYFLHCISNSIIYNILSAKFRKAFLTSIKNILLFRLKVN